MNSPNMNSQLNNAISFLKDEGFKFLPEDTSDFEATKLPRGLLEFYRDVGAPDGDSEFRMFDLAAIEVELQAMPGESLAPLGLIPIANDISGTPLCIDSTTFRSPSEGGEIYLMDGGDYSGMSYDDVIADATKKASSFADLLEKLPTLSY